MAHKIIVYLILGGLVVLSACIQNTTDKAGNNIHESKSNDTPIVVPVLKVIRASFNEEIICNGKVSASQKAVLPFEVQGIVNKVLVKNGQQVKAGMLLATLDDFTQLNSLLQVRNQMNRAMIELQDQLFVYNSQYKDTSKIPANIMRVVKIRSGFNDAKASLQLAEYNYRNTKLTAPVDGTIGQLDVRDHTPTSNYKFFCQILNNRTLLAEFSVLETEAPLLIKGREVMVKSFAFPDEQFKGKIDEIQPMVDENGMIKVRALVDNSRGKLLDGMNVQVTVRASLANQLVVPKNSCGKPSGPANCFYGGK